MTSRHARAVIRAACRGPVQAGRLRPTVRACCVRAGRSVSTGHRAFGPVAALHHVATDEVAARHAIQRRILGANVASCLVKSAVLVQAKFDERQRRRERWCAMLDARQLAEIETRESEALAVDRGSAA
jgi:hypothetical protein